MPNTLRNLIDAEKLIAEPTDWGISNRCLLLKLPLVVEGLIEEQFFFRATAIAHLPDQNVTFQLEYHGVRIPGGTGPLCRLEWNPRKTHNNKGKGPNEYRFIDQAGTHFHSFEDNWSEDSGPVLRDNLPVARPVVQDIQRFSDCLNVVGNLFRINNISVVKTPEWVVDLGSLWTP